MPMPALTASRIARKSRTSIFGEAVYGWPGLIYMLI